MGRKKGRVYIFDTTLRDGEQSPGFSMSVESKLKFARQLARLKVDAIEAGFPISSPAQFEAVKLIAQQIKGPRILGLARAVDKDIKACWDAVKYSKKPGIHTFISTSPIHMKYKLNKKPDEVVKMAVEAVKYAKSLCDYVEFSAEDATRSEVDFLEEIITKTIEAGATVINIPDTVGYAIPEEFGKLIRILKERISLLDKVILSVHCHNDLGLAVANSLIAIQNGATQVECTINGIGERAGNASLEEIVMALNVRKDFFKKEVKIVTQELYPASRLLTLLTGIPVQPNKAIVGENAFAHESGIHQDGVLKHKLTYEIMTPESVGRSKSHIVLGRHSGRHGVLKRAAELGFKLSKEEVDKIYEKFLEIADKKKQVYDDDLIAIIEETLRQKTRTWFILDYFHILSGNNILPTATVKLRKGDKTFSEAAYGDGPVDAVYKAIDKITKVQPILDDYSLKALSRGKDAMGEVRVILNYKGKRYFGIGASTDIIEASAKAYLNAVNKIILNTEKRSN